MVDERSKLRKERYVLAFMITLGIFLLGLFVGLLIEEQRLDYVKEVSEDQQNDYASLQIQYAFLDILTDEGNCETVMSSFNNYIKETEDARERVELYARNSKISSAEFDRIKRSYALAQLRYWLLAKKGQEVCDADTAAVLYFYTESERCPRCDEQGFVLTYLKKALGEKLLVFSFDERMEEEPMIGVLKNTYQIKEYPSLIIDDTLYSGFQGKDEILDVICEKYKEKTAYCLGRES